MSKNTDKYLNKKFGKLTVLSSFVTEPPYYYVYLNCKCDCGNILSIRKDVLIRKEKTNKTNSCGCSHHTRGVSNIGKHYDKKILNHIGKKFNRLTVIGVVSNIKGGYDLKCICDCGNETTQSHWDIKTNKVKSCGCYQKEQASITGSKIGINNYKNKYKWYFIKDDNKVYCRSGYEALYATYLIKSNIDFEYEPMCFTLSNGRRYTPDFFLNKENKYIEIKGSFKVNKSNQAENIKLFKNNHNITILFWENLIKICNLKFNTYNTYLRQARKLGIKEEDYIISIL